MRTLAETWAELIAAVVGAVLGWFSRHFLGPRNGR